MSLIKLIPLIQAKTKCKTWIIETIFVIKFIFNIID